MSDPIVGQIQDWLRAFPPQQPAVVVPAYNAHADLAACVDSLVNATPPSVPIIVLDDASTEAQISAALFSAYAERVFYGRNPVNLGFVGTANLGLAACAPRDVVLVNSDVLVPPAWLERLQRAAYCRSNVASATPLTNHGTIVSVPVRNHPYPIEGADFVRIDAQVQRHSLRLYPPIPTLVGHCVYLKRIALNLVGYFDPVFSPGYGEEVDWSQRATLLGFIHVAADDLFVYHRGGRSFATKGSDARQRLEAARERLINRRYPWYADWTTQAATQRESPLAYAIEQAKDAILGYRIAIDATCLGGPMTGTQQYVAELIRALSRAKPAGVRLSLIVNETALHRRADLLGVDELADEVLTPAQALQRPSPERFSLVHRPFQTGTLDEFRLLRQLAHRVIVSVLDFIAFSNVGYFFNHLDWTRYGEAIRAACALSDGVTFISADVADDARYFGVIPDPARARVIPPGTEHILARAGAAGEGAQPSEKLAKPFILVLGTNFKHKNRLYALKLLDALAEHARWEGQLVFAGSHVAWGGSDKEEQAFLKDRHSLRARVVDLGAVAEAEKQWLLRNAALVLHPSTREGFGFVPFEAAAAGVPALTAPTTAMRETLGDDVSYLSFDPVEDARLVQQLLTDASLRARQVASIRRRATEFTWQRAAEQLWAFYMHVLHIPPNPNRQVDFTIAGPAGAEPTAASALGGRVLIERAARRFKRALAVTSAEWGRLFADAAQLLRAWAMARRR